jgi:hypothetical protein
MTPALTGLRRFQSTDSTLVLRRYLTREHFDDFINRRELYFSQSSKFLDPLEGRRTDWDRRKTELQYQRWRFGPRESDMARTAQQEIEDHNRRVTFVCCWVSGPDESPKMWTAKGPDSVAIESTVGCLRTALGDEFLIAPVIYYRGGSTPDHHTLAPFLFKETRYSWEREVRAFGNMRSIDRIGIDHRRVTVDVSALVQRVIVSPESARTYVNDVAAIIGRAGMSLPVVDSERRR